MAKKLLFANSKWADMEVWAIRCGWGEYLYLQRKDSTPLGFGTLNGAEFYRTRTEALADLRQYDKTSRDARSPYIVKVRLREIDAMEREPEILAIAENRKLRQKVIELEEKLNITSAE